MVNTTFETYVYIEFNTGCNSKQFDINMFRSTSQHIIQLQSWRSLKNYQTHFFDHPKWRGPPRFTESIDVSYRAPAFPRYSMDRWITGCIASGAVNFRRSMMFTQRSMVATNHSRALFEVNVNADSPQDEPDPYKPWLAIHQYHEKVCIDQCFPCTMIDHWIPLPWRMALHW